MKKILISFMSILTACSTSEIERNFGPLKTVNRLDVPRFMGKWYVISSIPTFLEKGATNAVETYTWNQEENRIDVDFKFQKDQPDGELKSIPQKAFIYDQQTKAEWRVQPFWPLKFAYLVIDLDEKDYSYTVIGVPDRSYVWIMARTPQVDEALYHQILLKVKNLGYDTARIEKVPQIWK